MRHIMLLITSISISYHGLCQKKPLDHSVYDEWQAIGERSISNDGKFVVYAVNPQEGDGKLVIQASDNSYKREVPRGYAAVITEDSRYVIFRIRPLYKETREARIKKKTPDQMPKDSLAVAAFGMDSIIKIARVKSYKTPEKAGGWVAYHFEKSLPEPLRPSTQPDSLTRINSLIRMADSLARVADSLRSKAGEAKTKGMAVLQSLKKENSAAPKSPVDIVEEGSELIVRNLAKGEERKFQLVSEYYFSKKGNVLIIETTRKNNDSLSKAAIIWINTGNWKMDTVLKGFNDAKSYAIDEEGTKLAFVAERDSVTKALKKFYRLWYYQQGMDSASVKGDRNTEGVAKGYTISADYINNFSKDGKRLFIGLSPIRQPKDTSLADFETARLDIWNYKDDYLQPQQLVQLNNELKRSYLGVMNSGSDKIAALGDENCENIFLADEGNASYALGTSNKSYRIQQQWEQNNLNRIYLVNTNDGSRKLIRDKIRGFASISPKGNFILWYDWKKKHWFTYSVATGAIVNISSGIKVPLFDEEDDHPDDPPPYGTMGWQENDKYVFVYDKYDIWKCDPSGKEAPKNFTIGLGRKNKLTYRYVAVDREERFIKDTQDLYLSVFDERTKQNGLSHYGFAWKGGPALLTLSAHNYRSPLKARNHGSLLFTRESFNESPNVYVGQIRQVKDNRIETDNSIVVTKDSFIQLKLSNTNSQQKEYNWYGVELHKWKMFDGKMSEGLLYKPENFDSTRKYPVIFYFYERDADNRFDYIMPQPVRASINIPYFVSNGYMVFDPNIYYKTGHPGEDAYNAVVSAAKYLSNFKWIDTGRMGIQGHSWGGYQVAYLVTRTNMFAAAEAGAPVANMTSAYGGIRWGTGISRQFQYEHSQSRIGATLWQKPDLYIRSSPLFRADKVTTPLLMMHNDADGAVPWYQGIEYFSALRRLGKRVWMMQYNGEDHGLMERRNRKDWSIRLGQFFDYFLKGEKPARWITDGVPATSKGIDWGITQ